MLTKNDNSKALTIIGTKLTVTDVILQTMIALLLLEQWQSEHYRSRNTDRGRQ